MNRLSTFIAAALIATSIGAAPASAQRLGSANIVTTSQTGDNNGIGVAQYGRNSTAIVRQNGDNNVAGVIQQGHDQTTAVSQSGNNNGACVMTIGRGTSASVAQTGGERTAIVVTPRGTREMRPQRAARLCGV